MTLKERIKPKKLLKYMIPYGIIRAFQQWRYPDLQFVSIASGQAESSQQSIASGQAESSQQSVTSAQTETVVNVRCPFPVPNGNIKFSILVPLYNTNLVFLEEMLRSVIDQTYQNWQLILADGSDAQHPQVESVCREFARKDKRIVYFQLENNSGISENTNRCADFADGEYVCLLDHDDALMPNALFENARMINVTGADIIYSDEDHLSLEGCHVHPFFKPDWSPDLLMSQMYIGHLLVFKKELFDAVGRFRSEFDGAQDYDLFLRLSERTKSIAHIPLVLYSWRESETSTAYNADSKPYAHKAGRKAVEAHVKRVYGNEATAHDGEHLFTYDVRFAYKEKPLVSIIIPMKDKHELTEACINSILAKTTYPNFEIIILDNRSELEKTQQWLAECQKLDERIHVVKADFDFNWSRLNNLGIKCARGEVLVFLNNDTVILSKDWLERLSENCLRPDIGVVGGLLLYEDGTIQHAGVVVGMGGWADHVFKGVQPIHSVAPFVSPMLSRNVLAVTGACMAISRRTLERIGLFDEGFVICGSDVEICLRAYRAGLFNRYDSHVRLCHLESKSRDGFIPNVDYKMSGKSYAPYKEENDPFYNPNLDYSSCVPRKKANCSTEMDLETLEMRSQTFGVACRRVLAELKFPHWGSYGIPETLPIMPCRSSFEGLRLNLMIPSVAKHHCFGGISTALRFFFALRDKCGCAARIIITDAAYERSEAASLPEFVDVDPKVDSHIDSQLVPFNNRSNLLLPVGKNDVFVSTAWWTAYILGNVIPWQSDEYGQSSRPLVYLIQDYEPGFYAWSSRYVMAESTYHMRVPVVAAFNSMELKEYFDGIGYSFFRSYCFRPMLNPTLKALQEKLHTRCQRKNKTIVFYGRPGTPRNAFELIVTALHEWGEIQKDAGEWTLLSMGEQHPTLNLENGLVVRSTGKMTLEQYAETLAEAYAGISLMVSPHPSYPPLEMATFGVKTITNRYGNKDLSSFSPNIISLKDCSVHSIAEALKSVCEAYPGDVDLTVAADYTEERPEFGDIPDEVATLLKAFK